MVRLGLVVSSGVFKSVAGVGVSLGAAIHRAGVGFFTRVRPLVYLEVLQSGKTLPTRLVTTFVWSFARVCPHVNKHLVARIKTFTMPRATVPKTYKLIVISKFYVVFVDMVDQVVQGQEMLTAIFPLTGVEFGKAGGRERRRHDARYRRHLSLRCDLVVVENLSQKMLGGDHCVH